MPLIVPSMNILWFWFGREDRLEKFGTPEDIVRKFEILHSRNVLQDGLEIFLKPSKFENIEQFSPSFLDRFSRLNYKTLHIGEKDPDFLTNNTRIKKKLSLLSEFLEKLGIHMIVLHAHHLKRDRNKIRELFSETLPDITVCVENNGNDDQWGCNKETLIEILEECPEFRFCLDIAHLKEGNGKCSLNHFIQDDLLISKLEEIHFSYSLGSLEEDLYARQGFPGYRPLHGMFSVLGQHPSDRTKAFIRNYPVILEGIVPKEDRDLQFLRKEIELLAET